MFLKKDEFTHNGATVPITELSAFVMKEII